jgi:hypothetical protein
MFCTQLSPSAIELAAGGAEGREGEKDTQTKTWSLTRSSAPETYGTWGQQRESKATAVWPLGECAGRQKVTGESAKLSMSVIEYHGWNGNGQ